ncbi:MAG TPA: hypothetical protein PKV16_05440 [Caldisericia bacterium]|nr:hypothetical protein [Caldisericia bacterium]HPF48755.1 hypothetical protein [Caldisericia bacterium]HPI83585.1 hypothetical protein [Caldisericia bacterium]HPQ93210.1 hypothetical protein [Caldisericia bacterium]HRV74957.1 hypothetical protein [Caldisericia bacterium]
MKKFIVITLLLALLVPALPRVSALVSGVNLMGFIEEVDFGGLYLVVSGKKITFYPQIPIQNSKNKKCTIVDLKVGSFLDIKALSVGDDWQASSIKIVPANTVRHISSTVTLIDGDNVLMQNGMKLKLQKYREFVGFDELRVGMFVRIDGYTDGQTFKLWRFVQPYEENSIEDFYGKLTKYNTEILELDSNINIFHEGSILHNEKGEPLDDVDFCVGMSLRVTCQVKEGLFFATRCELFESVALGIELDSDVVTINRHPSNISTPFRKIDKDYYLPVFELLGMCQVRASYDEKANTITSIINGVKIQYDLGARTVERLGIIYPTDSDAIKYGNDFLVPLGAFIHLFGVDLPYRVYKPEHETKMFLIRS